jgi:hypothetical protein
MSEDANGALIEGAAAKSFPTGSPRQATARSDRRPIPPLSDRDQSFLTWALIKLLTARPTAEQAARLERARDRDELRAIMLEVGAQPLPPRAQVLDALATACGVTQTRARQLARYLPGGRSTLHRLRVRHNRRARRLSGVLARRPRPTARRGRRRQRARRRVTARRGPPGETEPAGDPDPPAGRPAITGWRP